MTTGSTAAMLLHAYEVRVAATPTSMESAETHREARQHRKRSSAFNIQGHADPDDCIDGVHLRDVVAGRPRAHVARRRKKSVAWSNGGTEKGLGRGCAFSEDRSSKDGRTIEALIALETRAIGKSVTGGQVVITCAMPIPLQWLVSAGWAQRWYVAPPTKKGNFSL